MIDFAIAINVSFFIPQLSSFILPIIMSTSDERNKLELSYMPVSNVDNGLFQNLASIENLYYMKRKLQIFSAGNEFGNTTF